MSDYKENVVKEDLVEVPVPENILHDRVLSLYGSEVVKDVDVDDEVIIIAKAKVKNAGERCIYYDYSSNMSDKDNGKKMYLRQEYIITEVKDIKIEKEMEKTNIHNNYVSLMK